MFRRVELIDEIGVREGVYEAFKHGLMGLSNDTVVDAWIESLRGPDRSIPSNARFWFTEAGWRSVGRRVVEACGRTGQKYRVVRVKESAVAVVWRDRFTGYEVAAQPLRPRRRGPASQARDADS